jgi:hypothetical protein
VVRTADKDNGANNNIARRWTNEDSIIYIYDGI